jgi:hypothetical protein
VTRMLKCGWAISVAASFYAPGCATHGRSRAVAGYSARRNGVKFDLVLDFFNMNSAA